MANKGEHHMCDMNLTFNDDADSLGGVIYFNREAYCTFTDGMNHFEVDKFYAHIDDLIAQRGYEELGQYPFLFFAKPADFNPKRYWMEPLGQERAEWHAANEEATAQTAVSRAKRHFYLMWLCARSDEVQKLQKEILLSTEELGELRGIGDPWWVEECRENTVSTIRQVQRMQKKYSSIEIADANKFLDDQDRRLANYRTSGGLCDLDDL